MENIDKLDGHWSKRTVFDQKTGIWYNKYFYKRKPAHRILLDTPKSKTLAGYILIEKDLRSAIIWLEEIIELLSEDENFHEDMNFVQTAYDRKKFNILKGLFVSALTFYAKSFAACEGRKVKLERSNLDEDYKKVHDNAMEYRHNFAAHSGAKKIEFVRIVLVLDQKRKAQPYLVKELGQPDTFGFNEMHELCKLFKYVRSLVNQKINALTGKIMKEDIFSRGTEYWYEKV